MNLRSLASAILLAMLPAMAQAACYADYKAKRDNPLRLHYGVAKVSDGSCPDRSRAAADIAGRIGRDNWELLNVVSLFGDGGLEERKKSAGDFFLRY